MASDLDCHRCNKTHEKEICKKELALLLKYFKRF